MKRSFFIMTALALMTAAQGKKVTIEGTSSSERMYLIINEDTEHALLLDIQDGKFSVTVNVNRNAFIRLQESKTFPRRAAAVLIPDSKHIIVDTDNQLIQNSGKSKELKILCIEMETAALYMNAAKAHKKALGMFTVSDHILTGEALSAEERQTSFRQMMEIALKTAAELAD